MLNLSSVRLEGFRAFPKASEAFDLSAPVVLLYGDNHQGKSSVLNAVEWCLYGGECIGRKSGIRERVGGWEVVNRQASVGSVELGLQTDKGIVTINRVEKAGKGKRGRHVQLTLPDDTVLTDEEAQREIARMLRLSFRDFATAVYQHQETIRAVLIQTPKERNEAIDRLLGLGDYRNVLEGIQSAKVGQLHRKLATEKETFEGRVEQALAVRQSDLEEKTQEAIAAGLDRSQLTAEGSLELARGVAKDLESFATQLGVPSAPPAVPSRWDEIVSFVVVARKELDRLWSKAPDVKEQSEFNARRGEAERMRLEYDGRRKEHAQASSNLGTFEAEHGNRQKIDESILQVQHQIDDGNEQMRRMSPRAKLVEEGITLLKAVADDEAAQVCPLCGESVPDLLGHLEREWTEKLEAQVRALKAAAKQLRQQKKQYEHLAVRHDDLAGLAEQAQAELADSTQRVAKFLDRELTGQDDPSALLSQHIQMADERLQEIESALTRKRTRLGAISASIDREDLVLQVLQLQAKIRGIEKIADTEEYKLLDWVRDKVAQLVTDVEVLTTLTRESLAGEARGRVSTAGGAIDTYFHKITQNPAIEGLQVEIAEDTRTGGNSYSFLDQDGREMNPVLSQGDLNSLALSIFLGMVAAYAHPVGFVLMDDPSQSLGTDQKRRLVEVIDEVCDTGRRVVLATMDSELQNFLRSGLSKTKNIYQISDWSPESGPTVSLEA